MIAICDMGVVNRKLMSYMCEGHLSDTRWLFSREVCVNYFFHGLKIRTCFCMRTSSLQPSESPQILLGSLRSKNESCRKVRTNLSRPTLISYTTSYWRLYMIQLYSINPSYLHSPYSYLFPPSTSSYMYPPFYTR